MSLAGAGMAGVGAPAVWIARMCATVPRARELARGGLRGRHAAADRPNLIPVTRAQGAIAAPFARSTGGCAMADVIVVGAGVIGLSASWRLASDGAEVVCCDPAPARGSSWAAGGMLAPVTEVTYGEEALLRLSLAGRARWDGFADDLAGATDVDVGYRRSGALVVARGSGDRAEIERLTAYQRELGLDVTLLRGSEARRREPALAPGISGAVDCPQDAQIDNRGLMDGLVDAAAGAGVDLRERAVAAIRHRGGRVRGVRLDDGTELDADRVVAAAGADSAALAGPDDPDIAAALPPVRPVKGQLLHLRAEPGEPALASRLVRGLLVYIVPRADGRVVVGATMEERGFDRRVTVRGVHDLLTYATELLPGLAEYELVESTAGLRPATPDNAPVVGAAGPDGLIVATGHWRNGVLLAPITAEAVVALAGGQDPPEEVAAFGPERFEGVRR